MKIALLTMEFPEGIKSNNYSLIETCNFLSRQGHNIYLLGPRNKKGDIREQFKFIKIGFINHRISNHKIKLLMFNLDYILGALFKILKLSPDLIICNGTGNFLYLKSLFSVFISKLKKIPFVQVWIGTDLLSQNTKFNKFLKKYILLKSNINMVQSAHMREIALKLTQNAKIVVIPNKGVDLIKFQKGKILTKPNKRKQDLFKLLYIGRSHPIKGTNYLIDAFLHIQKKYPNTYLDIVGIKPDEKILFKQIQDIHLDKIKFNGIVSYEKIFDFYYKTDVFILPSLMEGLSNVLMEAMACGLPIIATNVGGNKELIVNGKGGYLVQPKSAEELANAIINLIENPELRKNMGIYNLKAIRPYNSKIVMKRKAIIINYLYKRFFQ